MVIEEDADVTGVFDYVELDHVVVMEVRSQVGLDYIPENAYNLQSNVCCWRQMTRSGDGCGDEGKHWKLAK